MPLQTINDSIAVVVDGHSTGALLAPAFAAFGIGCVHVANRAEASPAHLRTFAPETYRALYDFDGDWARLLTALRAHPVAWVIAGTDSGVAVADRLAAELGLARHNSPATSRIRRDKSAMQQAAADAGLPVAWHTTATTPEDAARAVRRNGGGPVVVKPLRSGGTDGVQVCPTPQDAARAAAELLGGRTIYGEPNSAVLVQEYLRGAEYMVNSLSADGHHVITEMWRTSKTLVGSSPVYDYADLVPATHDHGVVAAYVRSVLDALGTRWGPAHTEVIVTAGGPRLVESAPRPQGTLDVSAITRATGRNPVMDAVHALIDPAFVTSGALPTTPVIRPARGVSFICPATGTLRADLDWPRVRALPSFHSLLAPVGRAGDEVHRTDDLFTRPGAVYLIHDDPATVEADHAAIRAWEHTGFYDIAETVPVPS